MTTGSDRGVILTNCQGPLGTKDKPQVFVRGKRALVVFQAGESRGIQSLVQADGKWLVD